MFKKLPIVLLLFCLWAGREARAQRIGGVPDYGFNPTDSGAPYHGGMFVNKASFWPSTGGRLFMGLPGDYNNYYFGIQDRYQKTRLYEISTASGAVDTTTKPLTRGFIRGFISTPQGRPVQVGTSDLYGNYDTVTLTKSYLRVAGTDEQVRRAWRGGKFAIANGATGNFKAGLVRMPGSTIGSNYLIFWITSNPIDTAGVHTRTTLIQIDTNNYAELRRLEIDDAVAEVGDYDALSDQARFAAHTLSGQPTGITVNLFFQGGQVALITGTLPDGPADLVRFLPSGQFLMAARWSGVPMVKRYTALGAEDATFPLTLLSAAGKYAFSYDGGTIRAASFDTTTDGQAASLFQYVMAANGGWASIQRTPLEPAYRAGRPLCYLPGIGSWLVESDNLPYPTVNGYPEPRYRFLVNAAGVLRSIGKAQGITSSNSYDWLEMDVNPLTNQVLMQNGIMLYNGKLSPGMVVAQANGAIDPAWTSALRLPTEMIRSTGFGYYNQNRRQQIYRNGNLATGNRVLFSPYHNLGQDTSSNDFPDTLYRYRFDGTLDPMTPTVRGMFLMRLKAGGFITTAFTNPAGLHRQAQQWEATTPAYQLQTIHVLRLTDGGDLRDTLGRLNYRALPDSLRNFGRAIYPFAEDEAGGVWIRGYLNSSAGQDSVGQRSWIARFMPGRRPLVIVPDSGYVPYGVSKIEVLPGGRFRYFGQMGRFIINGNYAASRKLQVVIMDSIGKFLPDPEFASRNPYQLPDTYGQRQSANYGSIGKLLPDGRFLAQHYYNGYSSIVNSVFLRDGRLDPSFLPIFSSGGLGYRGILGNRLYFGGRPRGVDEYGNTREGVVLNNVAGVVKNGLYSFILNQGPGDRGFVQGKIERVPSPVLAAQGCSPVGVRRPVAGAIVQAGTRIAITDTAGRYAMALDTGSYQVAQQIGNDLLMRQICPIARASIPVRLSQPSQVSLGNNFINESYDCPRITLNFGHGRGRLCSKGTLIVNYKNEGTATLPDARLRVFLPREMRIVSAQRPYIYEADSSYTFPIGDIAAGQSGFFTMVDTISCVPPDTNLRICYTARIEPMSVCGQIAQAQINWDGAWLDAKATYVSAPGPRQGQARYRIVNRGQDMADSVTALLVSNDYYPTFSGKIKLRAGDSLTLYTRAGLVFSSQLFLKQTADCPLGTGGTVGFSGTGITPTYLSLQDGWLGGQTVSTCFPIRFSYDPNEKLVYPDKLAEPAQRLDYTIHFENFGNDTAFSVLVLDSLPAELDVTGFVFKGGSHPCAVTVSGTTSQPVLSFAFSPIKLSAKKQDSVASKGYIQFSIPTKRNVARGTYVNNRAHIYFDRNPPVITEFSSVQIRPLEALVVTSAAKAQDPVMQVYPNPNRGQFRITLPKTPHGDQLELTDLSGKLISSRLLTGDQVDFAGLAPGVYIAKVSGLKAVRLVVNP